jgi:regulator of protease activity HflC (stomatin/prohibitin superfamily)
MATLIIIAIALLFVLFGIAASVRVVREYERA